MILNFYLPDEVITDMYGEVQNFTEKEQASEVLYMFFLAALDDTIRHMSPNLTEFLTESQMLARMEKTEDTVMEMMARSVQREIEKRMEEG